MSLQLRIAKHQLMDLKRIAKLGTSKLETIQKKLDNIEKPALRPQDLIEAIEDLAGEDTEPLVRQLLSLRGLVRQSGHSVSEVFSGVRDAIQLNGPDIDFVWDSWLNVENEVKKLVQLQCVRLATTAIELSYDYANLLQRTKILTDIRPLYNNDADEIEGAVISYTLRLRYDNAGGENELSIAMDESDINQLVEQCRRAIKKAETARKMIDDKIEIAVDISGKRSNE